MACADHASISGPRCWCRYRALYCVSSPILSRQAKNSVINYQISSRFIGLCQFSSKFICKTSCLIPEQPVADWESLEEIRLTW